MSISKAYVRPIVRGKEVKSVEFGAKCNNIQVDGLSFIEKCNNIQVDGLSFIEKLSFNAFNEGTRLTHCLKMHRKLFGVDAKKVGGDAIYAGSANREYCKDRGIQTSFVKRGRPWPETHQGKDEVDRNPVHLLWHPHGECSTARPAGQGKDEVDRNPVHLLWHPHGECSTARPAGSQRNCPGCLIFVSEKRPFHWSIGSS